MAMLFAVPRLVLVSKRLGRTAPVWRGHHLNFFPQEVSAPFRRKNRLAHPLRRRTYRLTGCLTRALFMANVRARKEASISRLRFTLAAAALFAVSAYLAQKPLAANDSEIRVTAKKYEFSPNVIKAKRGDHIRLVITALDRNHGFKLEALPH
jgi:Cupredoxin-like domain